MEQKLKVLFDVEIVDDDMNAELQDGFGRLKYSYQACGGGGGGCGRYTELDTLKRPEVMDGISHVR